MSLHRLFTVNDQPLSELIDEQYKNIRVRDVVHRLNEERYSINVCRWAMIALASYTGSLHELSMWESCYHHLNTVCEPTTCVDLMSYI